MSDNKKESIFRITDIEYTNSQIDDKIIGIFRFESSGSLKHGPTLIVLAEIDGVGYVYDQLIDVVNNEAEHSRNLLTGVEQEPVARFEKIIQNINKAVAAFLKEESSPLNWSRMNMFILELSEGHLCLAGIGRLMNMFLQKQPDDSYKTFDLFGSLDQRVDVDEEKIFSNIICGDFRVGDLLVAGSKNFERLRNDLRMRERLTTLPPVTAALEIKQDLEQRGIPDDFVATVVACREADGPKPALRDEEESKEKSTASIEQLRKTESETLRHLAPSITRKEGKANLKEPRAPHMGRFGFVKRIVDPVIGLVKRERVKDVASMVHLRGMHDGFGSFLTKRRKSLIIGGIILILSVLVIGSVIKHQRTLAAERAAWNMSYDEVKASIEQAEGEAEYSEDKARRTIANVMITIQNLDASTQEREEAIQTLRAQVAEIRTGLQRLVEVNNPEQAYALADGISDGALLSPIIFDGNLVVADRANEEIIAIDLDSGDETHVNLPSGNAAVKGLAAGRTSVIIILENGDLLAADLDSESVGALSLGLADGEHVTDALTYANRLYVLDAGSEQIWRHNSVSGGFGSGGKYLQATSADLSNAASLAIDANVYVLKSDGTVVRYFGGGQDGFSLSPIDPPLTSGNQIWADADNNYIVVADKAEKRVIVFTKEGKLVGQYVSDTFKGPTDVVADPATDKLYVIDGNRVFELLLP